MFKYKQNSITNSIIKNNKSKNLNIEYKIMKNNKIINRYNYYIKNWNNNKTIIEIPEYAKKYKRNELIYYNGLNIKENKEIVINNRFCWDQGPEFSLDIPCLTISADGIDNKNLPALVKVRYINNTFGGILCPLAYYRHWNNINNLKNIDIMWKNKINECVLRGNPTGFIQNWGEDVHTSKNLRIILCNKYKNKYNIGIVNTWDRWDKSCLKPSLTIQEMLQYKYQISVPGNDKDSGLNWKLASNSVVLMAKPTIESWLMEGLLQPYIHYVPLQDDYSDLDEILTWCQNNDGKCQEIVQNANTFMKQFENFEDEKKLFTMIKEFYKNTFIFV